jgi:hypothetical protein
MQKQTYSPANTFVNFVIWKNRERAIFHKELILLTLKYLCIFAKGILNEGLIRLTLMPSSSPGIFLP